MKRKWERDLGLQGRMLFTMFLLAVVYIFFLAFLSYYGTPPVFMILFIRSFHGYSVLLFGQIGSLDNGSTCSF